MFSANAKTISIPLNVYLRLFSMANVFNRDRISLLNNFSYRKKFIISTI